MRVRIAVQGVQQFTKVWLDDYEVKDVTCIEMEPLKPSKALPVVRITVFADELLLDMGDAEATVNAEPIRE